MEKLFTDIPNYAAAAHFLFGNYLSGREFFFLICEDEQEAQLAFEDASAVKENFFPSLSADLIQFSPGSNEKIKAAAKIYSSTCSKLLILPVSALNATLPSRRAWDGGSFTIKTGMKISRSKLLEIFSSFGYERVPFVENEGEFALRGSVADFFCPGRQYPERIYISDTVESIKTFEIATQQTISFLKDTSVISKTGEEIPLLSIGKSMGIFFFTAEPEGLDTSCFSKYFSSSAIPGITLKNSGYRANIKFNYDRILIFREIRELGSRGLNILISCRNQRELSALEEFLSQEKSLPPVKTFFSSLEKGFLCEKEKFAMLTFNELFSRYSIAASNSNTRKLKSFKFSDLSKGDFLVHEDFGIGKYLGIRKISDTVSEGEIRETECLEIEYARGDRLLVPLYEFKRVQKFIGAQGKAPKLSHMDTKTWSAVKSRVKKEIESIARELLLMEARRAAARIEPLAHAGEIEKAFENAFPYEETADQEKAIFETLSDLEKTTPMNRVIVGDVGFGKTEVAMRAAFRSAVNGSQVCVLCPTTILAEQHHRNFLKRFEGFPVKIEVISRLTRPSEARRIIASLSAGQTDIIIGTHKLLQKGIKFKKLALLIIDEEHKFGVKDKEKLKNLSRDLHCLMLSATPIPRTLYQSLSSLRTMSVIESPPFGRLPVYTKISPYDEAEIKKAVHAELAREGQIYYVYNRVETIESKKAALMKMLPSVRIAVVHGQMASSHIEKTMDEFLERKYDILLASTIIESGIDIPTVNTLIIENAHTLGLAQLYQLRGRIGREKQKAYCYLFFPSWLKSGSRISQEGKEKSTKDALSADAVRRLSALSEFSELGSGFRLAMRDLEIRGAGELLGPRQHGFINSIGLDMYIKLLNGEISKLRGTEVREERETAVDLNLPAHIPSDYIEDEMERLNYYKKILNADEAGLDKILSELKDISGPPPQALLNLAEIVKLRKRLAAMGVRSLTQKDETLEVFFEKTAHIKTEQILAWQSKFPSIRFLRTSGGDGFQVPFNGSVLRAVKEIFF